MKILKSKQMVMKASHLWEYYKIPFVCIIVGIGLVCYFANLLLHHEPDEILNIQFVNFYDNVSETSEFAGDFKEYMGMEESEGKIVFDNQAFFDLSNQSDFSNNYFVKTIAYLEAGTTDGVICSYDNLIGIAQGGRLMDLRDERTIKIYEKYKDRVVVFERDGKKIPVGIDISDSPVLNSMNGYIESCYIGISFNVAHAELTEMLLDYLLAGNLRM